MVGEAEGSVFGPWMIVRKTMRHNKSGARNVGSNQRGKDLDNEIVNEPGEINASGSRFDILEKEDMQVMQIQRENT